MPHNCPLVLFKIYDFLLPMFTIRNHVKELCIVIPLDNLENLSTQCPFEFFFSKESAQALLSFGLGVLLTNRKEIAFGF